MQSDLIKEFSGIMPFYIEKAKGCRFWDVDGREFIDYRMALGVVILGYCFDEIDQAVKSQIDNSIIDKEKILNKNGRWK